MNRGSRFLMSRLGSTLLVGAMVVAGCAGQSGGASPSPAAVGSPGAGSGQVDVIAVAQDAKLGAILTGEAGKTLYVLTKDTSGVSTCAGDCAATWPPFTLETGETVQGGAGATGTLATMTRADGGTQVTYNGAPLYYFSGDTSAGTTNGQSVGGVWYTVAPAGGPNMGSSSPSPSPTGGYGY
jgi:predicted lipoprotein with Yx(FWY)xxD motif